MNIETLKTFCCKPHEERPQLEQPWSAGEFTYATNGRILVRVPRLPDVPENDAAPSEKRVAELFATPQKDEWLPVPPLLPVEYSECCECNGKGKLFPNQPCPECNGTGSKSCCFCGVQETCKQCDGNGEIPNFAAP